MQKVTDEFNLFLAQSITEQSKKDAQMLAGEKVQKSKFQDVVGAGTDVEDSKA